MSELTRYLDVKPEVCPRCGAASLPATSPDLVLFPCRVLYAKQPDGTWLRLQACRGKAIDRN